MGPNEQFSLSFSPSREAHGFTPLMVVVDWW
jgi:hypothetical protein